VSATAPAPAGARARPWRILARGPLRRLWGAHLLTLLGDAFSFVAMPWLVLQLTGSGVALGTVLTLEAVPRALLMLVGGAVVDRVSPRVAMLGSAAVRAVVIGLLAALVLGHAVQLWQVYAIALLTGTVSAFFLPARFSILPTVVPDEELEAGNALLNLNQQGSVFVGPALAGLLVAAAGLGAAFVVDAATFGVAALLLLSVARRPAPAAASARAEAADLRQEILDGLGYAWADVGIRAVLLLIAVVDFASAGAMQVGMPVLARHRFALGAAAFGSLLAAWGAGSTAGVVGAGLRRVPARFGLLVVAGVAWFGASFAVLAVAPDLAVALGASAAMGVVSGVLNTYGFTWLQRRTDPAMQGRVMALVMLASMGLAPLSLALAGLLAGQPTVLFGAAAAIALVAAAGAALSRTVRSL
jgi:MFS family permease